MQDSPWRWAMCVGEESEAEYSEVGQEELQQLASEIKTEISQYGERYLNWSQIVDKIRNLYLLLFSQPTNYVKLYF